MSKQVAHGKAFEYAIASQISLTLKSEIFADSNYDKAKSSFDSIPPEEQKKMLLSAKEAVTFIAQKEGIHNYSSLFDIFIQPDLKGIKGDVRDIIVRSKSSDIEIGISAKNKHSAVKHSRLSANIDFGQKWFGVHNTETYWETIKPIFSELAQIKITGELWRNIKNKESRFYVPILKAFRDELSKLYEVNNIKVAKEFLRYLLGSHDFYKVIKENGSVKIQSFNISGSLKWGKKLPLPSRIIEADFKPNSKTTINIVFDHGWQVSFRIHNARSKVEASLKFDIQLTGTPPSVSSHTIDYREDSL
jgi:HaeIII restriction endonuclease